MRCVAAKYTKEKEKGRIIKVALKFWAGVSPVILEPSRPSASLLAGFDFAQTHFSGFIYLGRQCSRGNMRVLDPHAQGVGAQGQRF